VTVARTASADRRTRSTRGEERGAALIIAILMLVAMTGLGMLAVTTSQMEVRVAGNFRLLKQAQYVAEAGLIAAGSRIQDDPSSFARLIKKPGAVNPKWFPKDFGTNALFVTEADNPKDQSMGFDARPIDFTVEVVDVQDLPSCPGTGAGTMCCLKVGLVSEGRIGDFDDDGLPLNAEAGAKRRVRAEYAVPYPCSK
jgi:hypothetical protein